MSGTKILIGIGALILGIVLITTALNYLENGSYGRDLATPVDFSESSIDIKITFYEDRLELVRAYHDSMNNEKTDSELREWIRNHDLRGFANLQYNTISGTEPHPTNAAPSCHVHVMRVRGQNDTDRKRTLGHEILHCVHGEWHPESSH